ncbi:methyltransferase domain-containing protein [Leptolyngbya sp. AN02str]|uniref:class I SAM-dependent methyltransferase n=1 Tax=Leptolyngbya sp. AN02str TaxID=3423363 RepID=UPI003D319152
MTATAPTANPSSTIDKSNSLSARMATRLVNSILAIKPVYNVAKTRARNMMIQRAESIGVYWHQEVEALRSRGGEAEFSPQWEADLAAMTNPNVQYPEYFLQSFHAYEEGNMGWLPAMEVEVAAYAVHARIWPGADAEGDARLRRSYHEALKPQLAHEPKDVLDLACSVGMSTAALQEAFPQANVTGLDLSPYFLAIAKYRAQAQAQKPIHWVHAAAEATGLPSASFDLVSAHLLFHELPQDAAIAVFQEARRLLRPGGYLAIMDMNPQSEIYAKMPPYILTLLKSTEPCLDEYFALDIEQAIEDAGFERPTMTCNTPRHRTVVARAR